MTCKWQRGMDWHLACPSQGESRDEPSPQRHVFSNAGDDLKKGEAQETEESLPECSPRGG